MITDFQYTALLRYRNDVIPVPPDGLSPVDAELLEMRLIEPGDYGFSDYGLVKVLAEPLSYQITEKGKQALEEYEMAQNKKRKEKRGQYLRELSIALIGAFFGSCLTLFIEHVIL